MSSLADPSSSDSTVDIAKPTRSGESKMLAALSGSPPKLEDAVFLYIGALYVRQTGVVTADYTSHGNELRLDATLEPSTADASSQWCETDYVLAVNLYDLSVYLVYLAWHENASDWKMTDDEDPIDYERFKPQNNNDWACLPGHESGIWPDTRRCVLAKVADNVHEWTLGDRSKLFTVGPTLLPPDSVPVLEIVESCI
jgi:hypothetical protein